MEKIEPIHIIKFLSFFVLVFSASFVTRNYCSSLESSAVKVPGRPPAIVFSIVWPILSILFGISWVLSDNIPIHNALFVTLIILCVSWLFTYSCIRTYGKFVAALILGFSVFTSITLTILLRKETWSMITLIPLTLWLSFASYLNTYELVLSNHT